MNINDQFQARSNIYKQRKSHDPRKEIHFHFIYKKLRKNATFIRNNAGQDIHITYCSQESRSVNPSIPRSITIYKLSQFLQKHRKIKKKNDFPTINKLRKRKGLCYTLKA